MRRRWWPISTLVLCVVLLGGLLPRLVDEASFYRANVWPLLRLWSQPEQQAQLAAAPVDVEALIEADRRLPPQAGVVFFTAGQDVDSSEYIAFHRALYYLSPRSVWWVVQTPDPDSERQPRWFQAAAPQGAEWLLAYGVGRPSRAQNVAEVGAASSLAWVGPGPAPATPEHPTTLWAGPAWPVGAGGALLTLLAAGAALLSLVERRWPWQPKASEALVLAWALGSVAISLGLLLGCALGLGLRTSTAVLAGSAWPACVWLQWRRVSTLRRTPTPWTRSGAAALAIALALGLVVLYVALLADGRPLQVWDSWVTWGMKARLIWQTDTIPSGVYADPSRAVTLLNYPLLVPLLEAWLYTWLGAPDDRLAGLINVGSYAAVLGLAFAALRSRGADVLLSTLGAAYLAAIWALAGLAGLAFADLPLALFALVTGVYLVRWLEGGPPATLLVAAVAGGALGWTKREGVLLLALFVLLAVLTARGSRRWAVPALLLGGAAISGPWLAFAWWRGLPDWQFVPVSLQAAIDNRERLGFALSTLARWSLSSDWGFPSLWMLGLVALGVSLARRGFRPADALPVLSLAYLLLMSTAYVFSAFVPYETHVLASLSRLMAQVAPLVGVWVVRRWLEARPGLAPVRRPAPADAACASPPGSSADRRRPALEDLGTASGAPLLRRPRPGTPRD